MAIELGINSYNSLEELNDYMMFRLNSDAWDNATDTQKEKAAITATREIDEQDIISTKYDSTQALEFPRTIDAGVLSTYTKKAHCEWVLELLEEDYEMKKDIENGMTLKAIDNVQISFGGNRRTIQESETKRNATRYLKRYLYSPTVTIR